MLKEQIHKEQCIDINDFSSTAQLFYLIFSHNSCAFGIWPQSYPKLSLNESDKWTEFQTADKKSSMQDFLQSGGKNDEGQILEQKEISQLGETLAKQDNRNNRVALKQFITSAFDDQNITAVETGKKDKMREFFKNRATNKKKEYRQ